MRKFKAKLTAGGHKDAWVTMQIPFDVGREYGTRGRVSVVVGLNGADFNTSLFPNGDGTHHVMVNKAMRAAAKASAGDTVDVALRRDDGTAEAPVPIDLAKALKGRRDAAKTFAATTPAARREYVLWIEGAKRAETRVERIAKAVAMLASGKKRPKQ